MRSALTRWLGLTVLGVLVSAGVYGQWAWDRQQEAQAVQAEQQRRMQEVRRQAEAKRLLESDPVKFQIYVKQVAIAAEVIGQGQQDASGPCANLSGFENGLGDPPPETQTCVVTDPGEGHATVKLTLQDGRVFGWPEP